MLLKPFSLHLLGDGLKLKPSRSKLGKTATREMACLFRASPTKETEWMRIHGTGPNKDRQEKNEVPGNCTYLKGESRIDCFFFLF